LVGGVKVQISYVVFGKESKLFYFSSYMNEGKYYSKKEEEGK